MAKTKASDTKAAQATATEETTTKAVASAEGKRDFTIETKLRALFRLQAIDSEIDRIRTIRGELPLEVQDLEDEVVGLETRINNFTEEVNGLEDQIVNKKNQIKDALALIKKYEEQQGKVRNNREYDSLSKEIEFQGLEMQLAEKKIKEFKAQIEQKNVLIDKAKNDLEERKTDLKAKKAELDDIIAETQKEEDKLMETSEQAYAIIEPRLQYAYKRLRSNARNGLAVVTVQRDACGGCFNQIPPQRQLDIRTRKKIIVCEYCGRILVDPEIETSDAPVEAIV
jgi:predicted  nucleic acid-binding Zn-ribbon protein